MEQFRHEIKYFINRSTALSLSKRLDAALSRDDHCMEDAYTVRSLYFDDVYKSSLMDKLNGHSASRKFRLRYYNHEINHINAEVKVKKSGFIKKYAEPVGDVNTWNLMAHTKSEGVLSKYAIAYKQKRLRPKVIIYYKRLAWTYKPLNIRITIDYDLRYSENVSRFTDVHSPMVSMGEDRLAILEVKYNQFLPSFIKKIMANTTAEFVSISKYLMAMEAIDHKNKLKMTGGF